ncbi:hypothetical protein MN608_11093 [Microdochium nivale]|nr:hypothetical protein MN608_11093 [Microdochium nivale]
MAVCDSSCVSNLPPRKSFCIPRRRSIQATRRTPNPGHCVVQCKKDRRNFVLASADFRNGRTVAVISELWKARDRWQESFLLKVHCERMNMSCFLYFPQKFSTIADIQKLDLWLSRLVE